MISTDSRRRATLPECIREEIEKLGFTVRTKALVALLKDSPSLNKFMKVVKESVPEEDYQAVALKLWNCHMNGSVPCNEAYQYACTDAGGSAYYTWYNAALEYPSIIGRYFYPAIKRSTLDRWHHAMMVICNEDVAYCPQCKTGVEVEGGVAAHGMHLICMECGSAIED